MKCNEIFVPKKCCYIRFVTKKNVLKNKLIRNSSSEMVSFRGEQMIIDLDKRGWVIGIELLGTKDCRKPCQETATKVARRTVKAIERSLK